MKKIVKQWIRTTVFGFCLWLLYLTMEKIGWNAIVDSFKNISMVGIVCIFLYPITWRLFQSYNLYLSSDIKGSKYIDFFNAQVSSLFVGDIFPLGGLGGEAYRVYYLHKRYPQKLSNLMAGIVLYNILAFFVLFLFFCITLIYLTVVYPLPLQLKIMFIGFSTLLLFLSILIFILQKKGLFLGLLAFLGKIKGFKKYTKKAQEKVQWVDSVISNFFKANPRRFIKAFVSLVIVRLLGILEILMISYFVTEMFTIEQSVWLVLADSFVQAFLFFMPGGQIGVLESVVNGAGLLVSIPLVSVGILSIWKRLRTLVWAFIGLLIIIFSKTPIHKVVKREGL